MKELLDKLSSYNLFNYLLPGTLFITAAERISSTRFTKGELLVDVFLYYFAGLVISRMGSLLLGPVLKRLPGLSFAPYADFTRACDADPKLEVLSEQNNMYRTLCAAFVALPVFKGLDIAATAIGFTPMVSSLASFVALALLFAAAYHKQTGFVRKRVEARLK